MPNDAVLYEVRDEIAFVTLNRPEKRNAMNGDMAEGLIEAWKAMEADPEVKVALLSGAGRDFSVGYDLTPGSQRDTPHYMHSAYPGNGKTVFKPIVSAIHGNVMGGGYAFGVRCADLTIAADTTVLGFPEARAGIAIPPIDYLPLMPFKISLEFMLLAWKGGRFMDAQRAYNLGLVNQVVSEDELMAEAIRWCDLLKRVPPLYIRSIKRGHYKAASASFVEQEMEFLDFIYPQQKSEDRLEALAAFREKREPRFTGR